MKPGPPAEIGDPVDAIDTPALIIEMEPFERNLRRMAEAAGAAGVSLRPHAKTHKSPIIARRQMALGAVGACCQKVSEAEIMVQGGVDEVYVCNEIVGERKLRRLAALACQARVATCVDHPDAVDALSDAAHEFDAVLSVLVEIDVGDQRAGVVPGEAALALAQRVTDAPGLAFTGLQAYRGSAQHVRNHAERRALAARAAEQAAATKVLLENHGINCPTITGGGTGTFQFDLTSGVYTEVQAGSYIFMDSDYAQNLGADGEPVHTFEHSLFVLAAVMSQAAPERATLDAGHKAASVDSGLPLVHNRAGLEYVRASDEHGKIAVTPGAAVPQLGERLRLIPGHCDPTVNLHDWYVCVRAGRVEALWPVTARGAVF